MHSRLMLAALVVSASFAPAALAAQTYTSRLAVPPTYAAGEFLGGGATTGTGSGSIPVEIPGIPNAFTVNAFIYNVNTNTYTNLHPDSSWSGTWALNASATQQVGYGFQSGPNVALLWNGTAQSAITLDTPETDQTVATDTNGTRQVGYAFTRKSNGNPNAIVWAGTAASGTIIHPTNLGLESSVATTINEAGQIAGVGEDENYLFTALYWASPESPAVRLRPEGFDETTSAGAYQGKVFGDGSGLPTNGRRHALILDPENPNSFTSLHPSDPSILGTYIDTLQEVTPDGAPGSLPLIIGNALVEIDPGSGEGRQHAAVWTDHTASGFVDLHAFAPEGWDFSRASGVDAFGNIYGSVFNVDPNTGATDILPVIWSPVVIPEPTLTLLAPLALLATRRSRHA